MRDEDLPRHLQLLWNRTPSGRRGPRASRSIAEIGAAAVALADDGGADALTVQGVARRVGLTTMALYRYVDSRAALVDVALDHAAGPPPTLGAEGWRARTEEWAQRAAEWRRSHPWVLDVRSGPPATPNLLGWMERGIDAVEGLGLPPRESYSSLLIVDTFVSGHVRTAQMVGGATVAEEAAASTRYVETLAHVVDPTTFPRLAQQAESVFGADDELFYDAELRAGLAVILDGLQARVDRST